MAPICDSFKIDRLELESWSYIHVEKRTTYVAFAENTFSKKCNYNSMNFKPEGHGSYGRCKQAKSGKKMFSDFNSRNQGDFRQFLAKMAFFWKIDYMYDPIFSQISNTLSTKCHYIFFAKFFGGNTSWNTRKSSLSQQDLGSNPARALGWWMMIAMLYVTCIVCECHRMGKMGQPELFFSKAREVFHSGVMSEITIEI
jgi:hypothetical protein